MADYTAHDGAVLHVESAGEGSALIAIAGGPARHPVYLGDLAGIGHAHRVLTPHLRGVGLSPATDGRGGFWQQAADLEALRLHLGLDTVTLLGHSAGSRLAVAYAAQYPDRVERLVLVTPPARYLVDVPSDSDEIAAARTDDAFVTAWALLGMDPEPEGFTSWQHATAAAGYARWTEVEQAHAVVGEWRYAAAMAFLEHPAPADLVERLARVQAPVLVVAGRQDALTGFAPVAAVPELFPNGSLAVIDDCGHYPWVEQPREFRRIVEGFLG